MSPEPAAVRSSIKREVLAHKLRRALTEASLSSAGFADSLSRKRAAIDRLVPMRVVVRHDEGVTIMRLAEADMP